MKSIELTVHGVVGLKKKIASAEGHSMDIYVEAWIHESNYTGGAHNVIKQRTELHSSNVEYKLDWCETLTFMLPDRYFTYMAMENHQNSGFITIQLYAHRKYKSVVSSILGSSVLLGGVTIPLSEIIHKSSTVYANNGNEKTLRMERQRYPVAIAKSCVTANVVISVAFKSLAAGRSDYYLMFRQGQQTNLRDRILSCPGPDDYPIFQQQQQGIKSSGTDDFPVFEARQQSSDTNHLPTRAVGVRQNMSEYYCAQNIGNRDDCMTSYSNNRYEKLEEIPLVHPLRRKHLPLKRRARVTSIGCGSLLERIKCGSTDEDY